MAGDRRRLRITKMRGSTLVSGYHDYAITTGEVKVFPRVVASQSRREGENTPMSSGVPALDALLGGGLDRGTSTLSIGAAGTGKSSLATHFAMSAAARGELSALFLFDGKRARAGDALDRTGHRHPVAECRSDYEQQVSERFGTVAFSKLSGEVGKWLSNFLHIASPLPIAAKPAEHALPS